MRLESLGRPTKAVYRYSLPIIGIYRHFSVPVNSVNSFLFKNRFDKPKYAFPQKIVETWEIGIKMN